MSSMSIELDGFHDERAHPRGLLRSCLLLLLAEAPAHGYALIERLRPFGYEGHDPGAVYRALRSLERCQLVTSSWDTLNRGPARRVYELSPAGEKELRVVAEGLVDLGKQLDEYLTRYAVIERPWKQQR
jgi:poly-beta-hydroxybutyrate-responsive repressor